MLLHILVVGFFKSSLLPHFLKLTAHFTMEHYFEIKMQVSIKRNPGLYNHIKSCVRTCVYVMSASNFLYISENVVAAQYAHVTLGAREGNVVQPSEDRKFRYCERRHGPAVAFLTSFSFRI